MPETRKKKAYFWETSIYISLVKNKRLLCCAFVLGIPFAISGVPGWRLVNVGTVSGPGGSVAQVIAKDYSTHHPLLHTLFPGAFFKLGGTVAAADRDRAVSVSVYGDCSRHFAIPFDERCW